MIPTPRLITILSLLQFFFISGGYLLARIFVGLVEKADKEFPGGFDTFVEWHQKREPVLTFLALLIGHYGLLFLPAPLFLFTLVGFRDRDAPTLAFMTDRRLLFTLVFTAAVIFLFTIAAFQAIRLNAPIVT